MVTGPVDGNWGGYGPYGACEGARYCSGKETRTRVCQAPLNGGVAICPTEGLATESRDCDLGSCADQNLCKLT